MSASDWDRFRLFAFACGRKVSQDVASGRKRSESPRRPFAYDGSGDPAPLTRADPVLPDRKIHEEPAVQLALQVDTADANRADIQAAVVPADAHRQQRLRRIQGRARGDGAHGVADTVLQNPGPEGHSRP